MTFARDKIVSEGLTFDDVLLLPAFSEVLPREVSIKSQFSRNIQLNTPIVSAAMDTVTEEVLAITMAREGGIGVIHKNMTLEEQTRQVRKVKRAYLVGEAAQELAACRTPNELDTKLLDRRHDASAQLGDPQERLGIVEALELAGQLCPAGQQPDHRDHRQL